MALTILTGEGFSCPPALFKAVQLKEIDRPLKRWPVGIFAVFSALLANILH